MDNFKYKFKKILKTSLVMLLIIPICLIFTACDNKLSAYDIAVKNGFNGTEIEWLNSLKSKSNYEIAVENGFEGTEAEWLASLKGKSAYELAVENGFKGTEAEWLASLQGQNGENGKNSERVDTYELYETAKTKGEIPSENYTYLDFLKDYFSTTSDYTSATANKNLMSVVSVYSYTSSTALSSSNAGSGVIYSLDDHGNAYIITNYHVAYQNSSNMYPFYKLYLYSQDNPIPAKFVGASRKYDLAVLKVESNELLLSSNAQAVTMRDYDPLLSENIYAIGDTSKSGITLTKGNISVESETIKMTIGGVSAYYREVRHDAYIFHGNSGGGLFDTNGYLIGITNGGVENTLINYAIPISNVKPLVENIIENYEKDGSTKATIYLTGIENNMIAESTLTIYDSDTGRVVTKEVVCIDAIEQGSLFELDGKLQVRDKIISITYNGTLYENIKTYTLKTLLLSSRAGDVITISAERRNEDETVTPINSTITLTEIFADKLA